MSLPLLAQVQRSQAAPKNIPSTGNHRRLKHGGALFATLSRPLETIGAFANTYCSGFVELFMSSILDLKSYTAIGHRQASLKC